MLVLEEMVQKGNVVELEIMEEADRDGDGYIGFEDFYRIMKKRGDDPLEDWSSDEEEG